MKKNRWLLLLLASVVLAGCAGEKKEHNIQSETMDGKKEQKAQEKGYDLSVSEKEKQKGTEELERILETGKENIEKLFFAVKQNKNPVVYTGKSSNMENYEKVEEFLKNAQRGQKGEVVIYQIKEDGRVIRNQFTYDGKEMYLMYMSACMNQGKVSFGETSRTRVKQWKYTEKGWFSYELCAPEWPEVTEVVQASAMMRIRPVDEKYLEIENQYLRPVGYQGNNLFLSEWKQGNMGNLDYVGIFDSFYQMIHQKAVDTQAFQNGIPKEEFETDLQRFLPVSSEELRNSRYYQKEQGTYVWQSLGVGNRVSNEVVNSIPEIVDMRENEDGTYTLSVESVNEISGEDCVFSHELTVRFLEDGDMMYIGNHLTGWGKYKEPEYQYRIEE